MVARRACRPDAEDRAAVDQEAGDEAAAAALGEPVRQRGNQRPLGSGQARRLLPLTVDGKALPLDSCAFNIEGEVVSFNEVSAEKPFAMALNKITVITANGTTLAGGSHTIGMAFEVAGFGVLKFDFVDEV